MKLYDPFLGTFYNTTSEYKYECYRCGKPISRERGLCKACELWFDEYMRSLKEDALHKNIKRRK